MSVWMRYAIAAAVFYALHQMFTKLAAERIGEGVGGFVVEAVAAATILVYLVYHKMSGSAPQPVSAGGVVYSALTGVCVGAGTLAFFLLFQKGGPLSAVPMVLAAGAALMAVIGIAAFRESAHWTRLAGIGFSIAGLYLVQYAPVK